MPEMFENPHLYEKINNTKNEVRKFNPEVFEISDFIKDNVKYNFFEWQKDAIENFLYYENPKSELKKEPVHLMFNMATGTGKTLVMAALIIYYYKKGYRHFLFFVNQNNIVDKTENNFIDSSHTKYLFKEKIYIDNKYVIIKNVTTFSDNPEHIEIKFTTIQKLYNDIHIEKENQTTLDDLHNKNIVMLADEAHHLNTLTNEPQTQLFGKTEINDRASIKEIERKGWEHAVIELILKKNGKKGISKNVLLEFTATVPETPRAIEKYRDKTIIKFPLRDFLRSGYTKQLNLIPSNLTKKERILLALSLNWYRHQIALKYGVHNFKPVILFRSKTIEESFNDYDEFLDIISKLEKNDFDFLKTIQDKVKRVENQLDLGLYEMGKSRIGQMLNFINDNMIDYNSIISWIKNNFVERNVIITNSKTNTTKTEKTEPEVDALLNSLEDSKNHIRAIFTVKRLTEGWDVLNLFDIVRLYDGQNVGGSNRTTPEATIQEKQLIGRGVRYYPFKYQDKEVNKQKFVDEPNHELRILEELYFYSDDENRYISELKKTLREDGFIDDGKKVVETKIKDNFIGDNNLDKLKIWLNEQEKKDDREQKFFNKIPSRLDNFYKLKGLNIQEQIFGAGKIEDFQKENVRLDIETTYVPDDIIISKKIEKHIILKAINFVSHSGNSLFTFEKLSKHLNISTIDDAIDVLLSKTKLQIHRPENVQFENVNNKEKLEITIKFLEFLEKDFNLYYMPFKGSKFFSKDFKEVFGSSKFKTIDRNRESIKLNFDWFSHSELYLTDIEKDLVNNFINGKMSELRKNYNKVLLLRNEEKYKIYDFKDGRGFMPDFLLLLEDYQNKPHFYQILIEPKGLDHVAYDNWKELFLLEITNQYGHKELLKYSNDKYHLIGLPFYNNDNVIEGVREKFENSFEILLLLHPQKQIT